jgi:hypothetical protein
MKLVKEEGNSHSNSTFKKSGPNEKNSTSIYEMFNQKRSSLKERSLNIVEDEESSDSELEANDHLSSLKSIPKSV